MKNFIAITTIVPKAVIGSFAPDKIPSETNTKPIGSGPFLLDKYDPTQVNLKRNDNYWGKTAFGTPAMTTINHPIFKSNNDGDLKLESGEIDASQQFTAQIWKMWEAGKPVTTWMKKKPITCLEHPFMISTGQPAGRTQRSGGPSRTASTTEYSTPTMSDYSVQPTQPHRADGVRVKFYDAAAGVGGWI